MKLIKILTTVFVSLVTIGCSSVSELKPVAGIDFPPVYSIGNVEVEDRTGKEYELEGGANISVLMETAMYKALDDSGKREVKGSELSYEILIVDYQAGNAFARWLMPGAGKTILSVEGFVKDSTGTVLAATQASESVGAGGGYTIGAWKTVFDKVAKMLVKDLP